MYVKKEIRKLCRNSVKLDIGGETKVQVGASRFGGKPDVPQDFKWEQFEGTNYVNDEAKARPLSFIAQFNCRELAEFDTEGLLPKKGLLSFFYECESQCWGYDPKDKGCARVYWFEDTETLAPAEFPSELAEEFRFPPLGIKISSESSYPSYEDLVSVRDKLVERWEEYDEAAASLGIEEPENRSKLLGWPDIIQSNMTMECELVSRGYYLGSRDSWDEITKRDKQEAKDHSLKDWILLFQLDTVENGDFELMFGDCGRLYFYIRKKDLAERNFENVWLILQCG